MKDYKRLTNPNLEEYYPKHDFCLGCEHFENHTCNRWNGNCANYEDFNRVYDRLFDLEDKIERGEIDCVAAKDKEIARLTEENERLSKQLTDGKCIYLSDSETEEGCVQSPCPNYKTVEDILKENAALNARLDKAVVFPCVDKEDWYYTVKFPARVEDEIFIINKETNSILSAAVNNIVSYDESGKEWIFSIRYDCEGCDKYGECDYFDCPSKNCIWGDMDIPHGDNEYVVGYTGVNLSDYNKTWFTDRTKAEARLAELKGGEGE